MKLRPVLLMALLALPFVSAPAFAAGKKKPPAPAPAVVEVAPPAPVDPLATRPEVGPTKPFVPPVPEASKLSNGTSVWVLPAPSLPLVSVILEVPGGSSLDPVGREGTASLAGRMLSRGAGDRSADEFVAEVDRLGAELDVSTTQYSSQIVLSVHKDHLSEALDLVADMVLRPHFGRKDFKRERDLAAADLAYELDEPVAIAQRLAFSLYFGPGQPWSRPVSGTTSGIDHVKKGDVKRYHAATWTGGNATITLAGAVTAAEATGLLEPRFGGDAWEKAPGAKSVVPVPPVHADEPIYVVDRPDSAQTVFYLVFPGPAYGAPDEAAYEAGTIALGGTFTSRLNALLREKKGYTYGARARVVQLPGAGALVVSTRIRTDATALALTDTVGELKGIGQGVTPEELLKARGAWQTDVVAAMEDRTGMAATFSVYHFLGMSPTALGADLSEMGAVTVEQVAPAMGSYDPAKGVFLLVGDWSAIKGPLTEAGFNRVVLVPPI